MNNEYIIINRTSLEKRIQELEKEEVSQFSPGKRLWVDSAIENLKEVLSQSTPLIPEIEKAFDNGSKSGSNNWDSYLAPNIEVDKEDYISNLKLDI